MTHKWLVNYPRGSWPVYTCEACGVRHCPSAEEMQRNMPPAWWDGDCRGPRELSRDDIEWLTGTGRYGQ